MEPKGHISFTALGPLIYDYRTLPALVSLLIDGHTYLGKNLNGLSGVILAAEAADSRVTDTGRRIEKRAAR